MRTVTNLPAQPTSFIGRQHELHDVLELLRRNDLRLLTLTGPGGIGKTRLAQEAAAQVVDEFPDGAWWVPLAAIHDHHLVRDTVIQTLQLKGDLEEHLRHHRLLLLLDNFEHVIDAAPAVSDLLVSCSGLHVLVTSRERLRVLGEQEYAVPPLTDDEASSFFMARARLLEPNFVSADGAISEICRRLDRLPLALELAAARVRTVSVPQMLARLERRLPLLTHGFRDLPERHRTLNATIAWSYELLSPDEQRLFRRLSVFVGGCTLETAEQVADADLDTMQSLVEKSLVTWGGDRFAMLETIREFAEERLDESGEQEEVRRRQAENIAELAPVLGWRARASDLAALQRLDAEYDNARAAFDYALARGALELCERLVEGLWLYWMLKGLTLEGYRRAQDVLSRSDSPSPLFLNLSGELARFSGDLDGAVALKERGVAALEATAAHNPTGSPSDAASTSARLAMALTDLAETLVARGDLDRAESLAERALAIRAQGDVPFGVPHARAALVRLELRRGNYRRAAALSEESIPTWRQMQRWGDLAWECVLAATAYRRAGDTATARMRLADGLRLGIEAQENTALAAGLEQAAALAAESRRYDLSVRLYSSAAAWRLSSGYVFDRDDSAQHVTADLLPDEQRSALSDEGGRMPLVEAASYALDALALDTSVGARNAPSPQVNGVELTAREADVLALVAAALTNRQIATRLHLSPRTVEKHVERILAKTRLANRTALAASISRTRPSKPRT